MTRTHLTGLLTAVLAFSVGCGGGEGFTDRVAALSEPTGALASGDPQLVEWIQALAAERHLPHQLDGSLGPPEENTAAALAGTYSQSLHEKLADDLAKYADPEAPFDDRGGFLRRHAKLADETAAAIDLTQCRWNAEHRLGFFNRMSYLDDASTAARLMTSRAIQRGLNEKLPDSLADLRRALRVAHELTNVRRVEARVLGASLRGEALYAAYTLMNLGNYERFEAEMLHETLRNQLADWPIDARMLVGERATIIHAYEAIRSGMLNRVLVGSERAHLKSLGVLPQLEEATPAAINADQLRCLETMAILIESAGAVGAARRATIEQAMAKLAGGPRLFASYLFMPDLPGAIRLAAEDRARTEAWAIALAGVAKLKTPPFRISPLTGEPYIAEQPADRLAILYGTKPKQRVELPMLASGR